MLKVEAFHGQEFEVWGISPAPQIPNTNRHFFGRLAPHDLDYETQEHVQTSTTSTKKKKNIQSCIINKKDGNKL